MKWSPYVDPVSAASSWSKAAIMVRPVRVLHNHTGQDSYLSYLVRTEIEVKLSWTH